MKAKLYEFLIRDQFCTVGLRMASFTCTEQPPGQLVAQLASVLRRFSLLGVLTEFTK